MAEDMGRQRLRIGLPPDWITPRGDEIDPKVDSYNPDYKPGGGDKRIFHERVEIQAGSKIDSLEYQSHQPGGGNKPIFNERLEFDRDVKAKIGSLDNAVHKPGGGDKRFVHSERLRWTDQPALNTRENLAYHSRPSDVRIFNDQLDFTDRAEPKVGSLDNKTYEPKQSGVKVYHEHLPWLEHQSNRPRLRRNSGDGHEDAWSRQQEYSKRIETIGQKQQQQQPSRPRQPQPRRAASEEAATRERRRGEFADRTAAVAAEKPAKTRPRRLPNERDPKRPDPAAEAAAEERRRRQRQLQEERELREQRQQQQQQQRQKETEQMQKQREQERQQKQREQERQQKKREQERQQKQREHEEQQRRREQERQQKQQQQHQQPGNNSRAEQKASGEPGRPGDKTQRGAEAAGGGGGGGMAKEKQQAKQQQQQQQQPQQPQKQRQPQQAAKQQQQQQQKQQKTTKQQSQPQQPQQPHQPQQPQREPDDWEYARHEYDRPPPKPESQQQQQKKKKKKEDAAAKEDEESSDSVPPPPLELTEQQQQLASSRGVRDLYKTEGYAKRFELAPASVTNRSLILQPLDNYRHDWHEDAEVKVRLDGDGRLVLKSNRKVPTRLPRVAAESTEPPQPATYVSSISKKERPLYDPKPKRVTGEDLGHLLPRIEQLLEAPSAPKKHYSQYSLDRKPAEKGGGGGGGGSYGESMKRHRERHGYSVNPEGERVVLISSDDYNNQFYSEVRVKDAQMQPRTEGPYARRYEQEQLMQQPQQPQSQPLTAGAEPQADELSDRLLLQPSSDQLPHFRPESDGDFPGSLEDEAEDGESSGMTPGQLQRRQQRKQKRFITWKPGEVLYATADRGGDGGGTGATAAAAAYSERLQKQRQRQQQQLQQQQQLHQQQQSGFSGLHEHRKNWYQDYNQKMLAREGNVEKVSQRDLMLTTYELY